MLFRVVLTRRLVGARGGPLEAEFLCVVPHEVRRTVHLVLDDRLGVFVDHTRHELATVVRVLIKSVAIAVGVATCLPS